MQLDARKATLVTLCKRLGLPSWGLQSQVEARLRNHQDGLPLPSPPANPAPPPVQLAASSTVLAHPATTTSTVGPIGDGRPPLAQHSFLVGIAAPSTHPATLGACTPPVPAALQVLLPQPQAPPSIVGSLPTSGSGPVAA